LLPIWKQCYALAVLADCLNALAVGAPLLPTFRIRSGVLPAFFCALIRAFFRSMLRYNPGGFMVKPSAGYGHPCGQQAFSLLLFSSASFSSLAFYTYILALLLPSSFTHRRPMRFSKCLAATTHQPTHLCHMLGRMMSAMTL
jgi:hypothetical protein